VSPRISFAGIKWRRLTLRTRLTVITAFAVAIVVVTVSMSCWWLIRIRLYQQLDTQLRSDAQTAVQMNLRGQTPDDVVRTLLTTDQPLGDWRDDAGPPPIVVRFLDPAGAVTATSSGTQALGPSGPAVAEIAAAGTGSVIGSAGPGKHFYEMITVADPGGAVQIARRSGAIEDTLTLLGALLTAIGLTGAAGAGLIGWTVAKAGLRPVDLLTDAVEKVARTHDLDGKITVSGHDEIARLAEAFNGMLAALGASRAAQKRLVQDAGHELGTPLTSLRNNIELLIHAEEQRDSGRVLSSEDRARLLTDLGVQVTELTALTTELVALAAESADPEPFEPLDLAEVVTGAVDRARVRWPTTVFTVDTVPANRAGQPAALERAVLNLLDNAGKWSPPGGTVQVRLAVRFDVSPGGESDDSGGVAELTVTDAGPGIAEQDRAKVFERFYRATAARSMPGSGLGLAIVAQTVAAHEGTATVDDAPVGPGARLRVRLPLGAAS
jgi:two-component system sensor histidine kinase MprB